eukprot:scaffold100757_cov24-Prasinocladus_malaysianus.AAC.1
MRNKALVESPYSQNSGGLASKCWRHLPTRLGSYWNVRRPAIATDDADICQSRPYCEVVAKAICFGFVDISCTPRYP